MSEQLDNPTGKVWRRARGVYLAHVWDDVDGGEFFDAFPTEAKAVRWVVAQLPNDTPYRWERTAEGLQLFGPDVV
jgi:hypothetical protein